MIKLADRNSQAPPRSTLDQFRSGLSPLWKGFKKKTMKILLHSPNCKIPSMKLKTTLIHQIHLQAIISIIKASKYLIIVKLLAGTNIKSPLKAMLILLYSQQLSPLTKSISFNRTV